MLSFLDFFFFYNVALLLEIDISVIKNDQYLSVILHIHVYEG